MATAKCTKMHYCCSAASAIAAATAGGYKQWVVERDQCARSSSSVRACMHVPQVVLVVVALAAVAAAAAVAVGEKRGGLCAGQRCSWRDCSTP
jgi:hypothetical protein